MGTERPRQPVPPGRRSRTSVKLPPNYVASLTVPSRIESVRPAVTFVVQTARALEVAAADDPLFEVAVNEALANAVKHGDGSELAVVTCELQLDARQFTLRVIDEGRGFTVPPPALPDVDQLPVNGYGMPIIQSVFPAVRAIRSEGRFGLELSLPLL